jgi:hypothetical protein
MLLSFENPDDRTLPLFDRLASVAVKSLASVPIQITYIPHGVYWVIARLGANGTRWEHAGNPDHIVDAFQVWLNSVTANKETLVADVESVLTKFPTPDPASDISEHVRRADSEGSAIRTGNSDLRTT